MIALTAWKSNERLVDMPIWLKIWGLKYWMALTPVIWQLAWMAMTKMVRRRFGQPRKRSRYVAFFWDRSSEIWNWMRSYSANTYGSSMSPYECNWASVRRASSARSWAQSHLNLVSEVHGVLLRGNDLGDSGNNIIRAPKMRAGAIWQPRGMRHSLLLPVPAQVI
jgi:hypothetical protein